ncbi:hypothetical protein ACQ4LE_008364 [Meloidogyne hapla]
MSIISKEDSSVTTSKKKGKKVVYIYRQLDKMDEKNVTLDDVFNGLSLSFVEVTEKHVYNLHLMLCLTDQFARGVAKNILVSMEAFKLAVKALESARRTTDIRTMPAFWPFFRQLFIHIKPEHLNEAISHFLSNKELLDSGNFRQKFVPMVESYKGYQEEFERVRQFIIYGDICDFNNDLLEKCRQLSFCLMLQPKRGVKELTISAMRSTEALENLIKFFHIVPSLIKHEIQNNKTRTMQPLALGLIRHILDHEISIIPIQEKIEFLERFIIGVINESILGENKVSPPIFEVCIFADLLDETEDNTIKLKVPYGCYLKYREH